MEVSKSKSIEKSIHHEEKSLKGTLASTLIFVGGGILIFIILLFIFYMTRV
ncbi:MAG TPA: hypothetical protein VK119_02120 [Bacillota bacterium]|nr:hypothetical protein [Bacillota bacterium]